MGRPVNKRYFGAQSGNQLQVIAKLEGEAVGTGYIVSQRGTRKYNVSINEVQGICRLVNVAGGAEDGSTLADGEMILNVTDDSGNVVQVTKLHNRLAIVEGNQKVKWNFSASVIDGAVQADDPVSIDISAQPAAATTVSGGASFIVVAASTEAITYQWQERAGAGSYVNVVDGGIYGGATTDTLVLTGASAGEDGYTYRCVMSGATADTINSSTAKLTFGD